MVTCNFDSMKKVEKPRRTVHTNNNNNNSSGSVTSSGFRLLDDHCDTVSSVSRNSIYKLKIDAMFDDTRYFDSFPYPSKSISLNIFSLATYFYGNQI